MTGRMQSHTNSISLIFHIRCGCIFGFSPLCLFKCLVKLFDWKDARSQSLHLVGFSPVCFSNVFSNGMTGRMQSHTSCICPIFLHCTFSKVSSNCLPERRHICIGCIFWLFSTVSIQMSGQIVSLQVCKVTLVTFVWLFSSVFFKCVLKWHDREDAKSQKLHLSDFSPLCILKCVFKLSVREKVYSHWLHFLAFLHCVFSNGSSNHLP